MSQQGVRNPAYQPAPTPYAEGLVEKFCNLVCRPADGLLPGMTRGHERPQTALAAARPSTAPCRACTSMSTGDACRRPGTAKPRKRCCARTSAPNARRQELLLPLAGRPCLRLHARPVPDAGAGDRRRAAEPLLHDLVAADPAAHCPSPSSACPAAPNWLHDHLSAGMTVRTLGPAGVFSNALHPAERYLFLSAGSGITPLMSMARTTAICATTATSSSSTAPARPTTSSSSANWTCWPRTCRVSAPTSSASSSAADHPGTG